MQEQQFVRAQRRLVNGNRLYWLRRPRLGETVCGVILNHTLFGVSTHWIRGRTVACQRESNACEGCDRGWVPIGRWYCGLWLPAMGKVEVLELTEGALDSSPDLWNPDIDLRGRTVKVRRPGPRGNSRVYAELGSLSPFSGYAPPEIDVEAQLRKIYGTFQQRKGGEP